MKETLRDIDSLSRQEKRELVARLLRKRAGKSPIEYPLSHGQRSLWFQHKLAPESAAYNVTFAARIPTMVDSGALRRSFQRLVDRHPMLRTTFTTRSGQPVQIIHPKLEVRFDDLDTSTWEADRLDKALFEQTDHPFDLELGPLMRVGLFTRAADDHIFLLTVHHIIGDFWSLIILIEELRTLYPAERTGAEANLPTLDFQYVDYVGWQVEMLASQEGERLWQYWRDHLSGELPALDLPTDRPRQPIQTYNGESQVFNLSAELTEGLRSLAKTESATSFMVLLAAFQLLLHRHSSQDEILVGSPVTGRARPELSGIVGYFSNPIVARANFSDTPSFRVLLRRVRETVLGAIEHEDYPFSLLVERMRPVRDPSRSPLFQAMFLFERSHRLDQEGASLFIMGKPGARINLDHLVFESIPLAQRTVQFDLTLIMEETGGSHSAALQYNTDLFEASTIARLASHFENLLQSIVVNPDLRVSSLPMLSEQERRQLLFDWNQTAFSYPPMCFHQIFEAQVERAPDAIALVFDQSQLSYYEFNSRSNQLAHLLCGLGVGPEVTVGLVLDRSAEMMVGLLGIMKSGGAYVPIDPGYPESRVRYALEDAGAKVVVTQRRHEGMVSEEQRRIVSLDGERGALAQEERGNLNSGVMMENLAYVIYTSGSTGKPKGVEIEHRSLVNFLSSMKEEPGIRKEDVMVAVTTISFDIAGLELMLPIMVGGRVEIASREEAGDGERLKRRIEERRASVMQGTPATWRMLIEAGWEGEEGMKILCGGEAWGGELGRELRGRGGELWNLYGPTETTIWSAGEKVGEGEEVKIGRGIGNTQIYIVGRGREATGIGVRGEIEIGGEGVGRGYRGRAGMTGERFVPDEKGGVGRRVYRTGDIGRRGSGGRIEYLGRGDEQVKVRGYRIELGEIEGVMREQEGVREAVVIVREEAEGDKRIVAYVVPQATPSPRPAELRSYLKERLPDYMTPSAFVFLDALPLTPNGKVDRRALPAPQWASAESEETLAVPLTQTEEMVAAIWASVLKIEPPALHDNFFALGGHSLLATQIMSRIRGAFGVELPLPSIFEVPTVKGLARHIEKAIQSEVRLQAPPIVSEPRTDEMPLSFAQQRLWFLDQFEPGSPFYNVSAAFRISGQLNVLALEQSLNSIVARHEALRTIFESKEGRVVQSIIDEIEIPLPVICISEFGEDAREVETKRLATWESKRQFDLATGPLLRATLLHLAGQEHVLVLTVHHIVFDGWSVDVFIRELAALYESLCKGEPHRLSELPIQYADFARWQRNWLQGEVLEQQLAYWKSRLGDEPPILELPTDFPRPAVQTFCGARYPFLIPDRLSESVRLLSRQESVTLFMTLLAAFQTLLYRYTNQGDVIVGSSIANRNRAEIEGLIGFFVNTLVLRMNLSDNPKFRELMTREREVTLGAYAHQDLPFEYLVEALQPERDLGRTPLFQVMFILQNATSLCLQLPGLTLTPLELDRETSMFDLTLFIAETEKGLKGTFEYNTDLFEASTIARLASHFENLLQSIVVNPDLRVSSLPMLSEQERRQLLFDWNQTAFSYPPMCFHQIFEAQVERAPDAIALVFDQSQLSYYEFNSRSNQLAHLLCGLGVGPEVTVGLVLDRSAEMMVGLLGIMKSGGAYVPIDPGYPESRVRYALEDAGAKVVVTQRRHEGMVSEEQRRIVSLDGERGALAQEERGNLNSGVMMENLAYVIYTSGSTGKPKGVEIEHRSLVNFLSSMKEEPGIRKEDVMVAVTTISFDIAGLELMLPIMVGGRVEIASREEAGDGERLKRRIEERRASVMQGTPATWRMLIEAGWEGEEGMKILCGGEAWGGELGRELRGRGGELWNLYGPTETTIWSAGEKVGEGEEVKIGRGIGNTQIYIVGRGREATGIGVRGEIEIGGEGVGRGYRGRAGMTGERFVPDEKGGVGRRVYRTGDIGRRGSGGRIEYLGRGDEQVKVRGYRIELGEIEGVMREQEGVREAVVIVREEAEGDKRIVAYVVPHQRFGGTVDVDSQTIWFAEQSEQWKTIWDETYTQPQVSKAPAFNIVGWKSSYTGEALPDEWMREWVDFTADRILELKPKRVLEIGCGTGLLLFRIAQHCEQYCGTDFSSAALDYLKGQLATSKQGACDVTLLQRSAEEFQDFDGRGFDTVILNSVVQYFPSADYLARVLEGAVNLISNGGSIFIGDVRSLPLLETFHTSVQMAQAPPTLTTAELRQRVQRRLAQEEELVIDPVFFLALRDHLPEISDVEIQIKRGRYHNEMTLYRYDVLIRVGETRHSAQSLDWLDWKKSGLNISRLRRQLIETEPDILAITGLPNARLIPDLKAVELLATEDGPKTVGELREAIGQNIERDGIEPEDLWALGAKLPYEITIRWSDSGANHDCDLILHHRVKSKGVFEARPASFNVRHAVKDKTLSAYTNNPLRTIFARKLLSDLRAHLKQKLPEYMLPSAFVLLESLPLTPNGKVNRQALPSPDGASRDSKAVFVAPRTDIEQTIADVWKQALQLDKVGIHDNFFDLGGHSLLMAQVRSKLRGLLSKDLSIIEMFRYPTIGSYAKFLTQEQPEQVSRIKGQARASKRRGQSRHSGTDVAIIGMACRFPGAENIEQFWQNLLGGVESISFFTDQELISSGIKPSTLDDPDYVKAGSILKNADRFDAEFFGFNPREVELMDPQHRLFLECAWEALEDSGYDSKRYEDSIGVYAGASMNTYLFNIVSAVGFHDSEEAFQILLGNEKDYLATRTSYKLDLRGPSVNVLTACSTSLVAVHLACQSLLNGECEMALAGGVSVRSPQKSGYRFQPGGILSPDGHCRAFDANAAGTIFGSGAGIIVLKRLKDALVDGDSIHAVIKGSALNNDGSLKAGFTAPSVDRQAEVIAQALAVADLDPANITCIEAHGTGTALGDPIEVAALRQVFESDTDSKQFCAIGSVKTNIGHLDAAAGVAGLIKTVLALKHRALPPSLHFDRPNPQINFEQSPFYVNRTLTEWKTDRVPRRAGVSSFGIGGTNAHIVLEEAPDPQPSTGSRPSCLLLLSARTGSALDQATSNLVAFLKKRPDADLADIAYTLQQGRRQFSERRMLVCDSVEDALSALDPVDSRRVSSGCVEKEGRPIVFMFPGQGAQHVNMCAGLYETEPEFRRHVDHCSQLLLPHLKLDLREIIYPRGHQKDEAEAKLNQTCITQPALFVVEYAMARLWMEWGVNPTAMIGHSIGEYVAACLAGVFSLEDTLMLVAARGRMIQSLPGGAMLSVPLSEKELHPLMGEGLSLAATNAPSSSVVSGREDDIADFGDRLFKQGIECRRLRTSHAFHSAMMEPILRQFANLVRKAKPGPPGLPYVSNVSGNPVTKDETTDPFFWARHIRQTVRFAEGLSKLMKQHDSIFLEVGPGNGLTMLASQNQDMTGEHVLVCSSRHPRDKGSDNSAVLKALGNLWLAGTKVNWSGVYAHYRPRRISLPTYPFERERYWIEYREPLGQARPASTTAMAHSTVSSGVLKSGVEISPSNDSMSNNGKSDKHRSSKFHPRPKLHNEYIGSNNWIELAMIDIWQKLLGIEPIGISDDFFDLGGHSLLATQVMSRVRKAFQVDLTVDRLFEGPTVAALAMLVFSRQFEQADVEEVATILEEVKQVPAGELQALIAAEKQLFQEWALED